MTKQTTIVVIGNLRVNISGATSSLLNTGFKGAGYTLGEATLSELFYPSESVFVSF